MKPHVFCFFTLTLFCVFLHFAVQAMPHPDALVTNRGFLPSTNVVDKYERYSSVLGEWTSVSKTDGETVLTCLREHEKFERWVPNCPSLGVRARVAIPSTFVMRFICVDGSTNSVQISETGEFVHSFSGGLCIPIALAIPEAERAILSQLFKSWRDADIKRITSQALPCQFRVGSFKGGDTLSGIARLFYGDATKWTKIWEANKSTIPNPDIIRAGQLITIPKLEP